VAVSVIVVLLITVLIVIIVLKRRKENPHNNPLFDLNKLDIPDQDKITDVIVLERLGGGNFGTHHSFLQEHAMIYLLHRGRVQRGMAQQQCCCETVEGCATTG
jgi:hypothetical protein